MTLATCLEIGKECGLYSWKECYDNILLHTGSIFLYSKINEELLELQKDMYRIDKEKFCEIFDTTIEKMESLGW